MQDHRSGLKSVGVRSNFRLQFISTPTADTPGTCLVLHFDTKRYIFGELMEGIQRACIQRGIGLRKVRGLFLAGKTSWNNGGLIGMILTMADIQQSEVDPEDGMRRPRLHIYAGPKQLHSMACARRFVFRTGMPLSVHEFDVSQDHSEPIHEDDNIRVWALSTMPASPREGLEQEDFDVKTDGLTAIEETQLRRDQELRKEIIHNMFDSDWKHDRLVQAKLKDVKLPAVVWMRDPEKKTLTPYTCHDMHNTPPLTPDTNVQVRSPWPASTVEELPDTSGLPSAAAMSYIVKGHPQRGAFSPEKARILGLKPGRKYADLVAGKTVESDGDAKTIITPEMVLEPTRPGRGFALFDIPSVEYLKDLEQKLERNKELLQGVEIAVWITRRSVPQNHQFQQLLHRLNNMKHIISDPDICNDYIANDSSAISSLRLSNIAPSFFSVPRYDNSNAYRPGIDKSMADLTIPSNVMPAKRGLKIQIEPSFSIEETEVPCNLDLDILEKPLDQAVQEILPTDISSYRAPPISPGLDLDEPEIIALGTGSAAPSKYRNVSAILLRMPDGMGNYLFDCGENTLGQLKRIYTAGQLDEILFNLRGIWISHLHADHHLGTITVLQAAHQARTRLSTLLKPEPAAPCLMSEINMMDYVDEYQSILMIPTDRLCTPIAVHWSKGLSLRGKPVDFARMNVPIKDLRTVKVNHCHGAQAVSVTFTNGFKFSYSGDCRPNELFCEIGADSDVLVHEATFDDGMEGDAQAKKHCTTGEAVGVALGMRAKNLILTHFSQRYQKIPILSSVKMPEPVSEDELIDDVDAEVTNATNNTGSEKAQVAAPTTTAAADSSTWIKPDSVSDLNIAVAFDLMRIKVSQIKDMKKLFPAISKMFEIEEEAREKKRLETAAVVQAEAQRKKDEKGAAQLKKQQKAKESKQKASDNSKGNNKRKAHEENGAAAPASGAKENGYGSTINQNAIRNITANGVDPEITTNERGEAGILGPGAGAGETTVAATAAPKVIVNAKRSQTGDDLVSLETMPDRPQAETPTATSASTHSSPPPAENTQTGVDMHQPTDTALQSPPKRRRTNGVGTGEDGRGREDTGMEAA